MKITKELARKLAKKAVEDMSLDSLLEYAEESLEEWYYLHCPEDIFEDSWEEYFGSGIDEQ